MYRNALMIFFTTVSFSIAANSLVFSKGLKAKENYKHHKCIEGVFAAHALKAPLTSDEICRYGKEGCSSIVVKDKMTAYCELTLLSECFEKKSWLAIDQILSVKLTMEPGLVTYGLKKTSVDAGKTCAYWD